ncbi:MAG: FTR1 family iron permease [Nitrososphaerales archaeon]
MPAFLLSLREGLEAALIVGIVLGALGRLGKRNQARFVWLGVGAAFAASLLVAVGLDMVGAEFEGVAAQVFEGVTMLLAAGVLTWMIFWMQREGSEIHQRLTADVKAVAEEGARSGASLFLLAFLAVFREGIELALFLVAATFATSGLQTISGASGGLLLAAGLGYLMFAGSVRLNLKLFFRVTSLLLIVFAAGMLAYGVHELVEAAVLPALVEPVYNISPILSDQAGLGLLLKALFGYNSNPALLETMAYVAYFVVVWAALRMHKTLKPAGVSSSS